MVGNIKFLPILIDTLERLCYNGHIPNRTKVLYNIILMEDKLW